MAILTRGVTVCVLLLLSLFKKKTHFMKEDRREDGSREQNTAETQNEVSLLDEEVKSPS